VTVVGADAEKLGLPPSPGARPVTCGPEPDRYACSDELTLTSALLYSLDGTP
jgi:hypothetical protein